MSFVLCFADRYAHVLPLGLRPVVFEEFDLAGHHVLPPAENERYEIWSASGQEWPHGERP